MEVLFTWQESMIKLDIIYLLQNITVRTSQIQSPTEARVQKVKKDEVCRQGESHTDKLFVFL